MRAPKHLWSGDWERESAAAGDDLASLEELPRVVADPVAPEALRSEPEPPGPRTPPAPRAPRAPRVRGVRLRAPSRHASALAVVVMLTLAAAGYGLATLLSSTSVHDTPAPAGPNDTVRWLGMQVETVHPRHVVVATVAPGGEGERAGLEPGDVMIAIDSRALDSTADIAKAIFGIQAGDQVQIEVGRGSTVFITSATVGSPPAKYP